MLTRIKTFLADGSNPNGRLFAGDLNAIQDAVAAALDYAQTIGTGVVAVGESGLQILRYASGEARLTGALRTDGIFRGLGGIIPGAFTTTARNAITSPPYGLVILNTDTNQYEWNKGTSSVPIWSAIGSLLSSGVDVLANRPSASSVVSGSTYFATDQVVEYVSNGTSWLRKGTPAGATLDWFNSSAPTGWVAYDGGTLPGSTGIYADIYAHLGSTTTKPDTRGRVTVGQGSHADVDAIGDNDGILVANRTPVHKSTSALTLPSHTHTTSAGYGSFTGAGTSGQFGFGSSVSQTDPGSGDTHGVAGFVSAGPNEGALAMGGYIGPDNATRPSDRIPWTTCLKIAKL